MNAVVFIFLGMGVFFVYFGITMIYCSVRRGVLLGVIRACRLGCWDGQRAQEHGPASGSREWIADSRGKIMPNFVA